MSLDSSAGRRAPGAAHRPLAPRGRGNLERFGHDRWLPPHPAPPGTWRIRLTAG